MKKYKFNNIPGFLLAEPELDGETGGGGSGGSTRGSGGGTGGGQSGTTSSVILPSFSLSPSGNQSIAIGSTICFTASGSISLPQEPERIAVLDVGYGQSSNGVWVKSHGGNVYQYNSEASNSNVIYKKQPCYITGRNTFFNTPGGSINNSSTILGLKSTNGYFYYWEVFKYCEGDNSNGGDCGNRWFAYPKITTPTGVITLGGGHVEQNQIFRVKSTGNRIIWEYTTENNWVYNYATVPIPEEVGDFYFFVRS